MNENKKITQLDVATEIKPQDIIPIVQDGTNKQITKETLFAGVNDSEELNKKFEAKADKATTLKGYGITDAYTKKEVDKALENIDLADYYTKEETDAEIVFSEEDITDRTKVIIDDEEMNTMGSEVTNEKSDSKFLAYSANYLKDKLVCVSPTEPENGEEVWIQKGKNLIDINNLSFKDVGVVWGNNKYSSTKDWSGMGWDIPVEVGKTYTYKYKARNSEKIWFYINEFDGSGARVRQVVNDGYLTQYTFTIENENTKYIRVAYYNNAVISDLSIEDIILYEGSENLEYEPFIERKIFVKNHKGNYEEFIKPQVKVSPYMPTTGEEVWIQKSKNLYNKNAYLGHTYPKMYPTGKTELQASGYIRSTSNYYSGYSPGQMINVEKNTDYTLSLEIVDREVEGNTIVAIGYKSSAGTYGAFYTKAFKNILGLHVFNFNTGDNTEIIVSINGVFNAEGKQQWIDYDKVQLEKGTPSIIEYEPYVDNKIYTKNDGAYEEFSNGGDIYSSDEQIIGKWKDGRPIYRMVVEFSGTADNNYYLVQNSGIVSERIMKMKDVMRFDGFVEKDTVIVPIPNNGDYDCRTYLQRSYGGLGLIATASSVANFNNNKITFILEYTKTTD